MTKLIANTRRKVQGSLYQWRARRAVKLANKVGFTLLPPGRMNQLVQNSRALRNLLHTKGTNFRDRNGRAAVVRHITSISVALTAGQEEVAHIAGARK